MNRLATIDRVATLLHDERRRTTRTHHEPGGCFECRDLATFVVDEVVPAVVNPQPTTDLGPGLFDSKEINP